MGTSASSKGPGFGVSFDPPWLQEIEVPNQNESKISDDESPQWIAPKARFGNSRRLLGDYLRTGNRDSVRRSLGHYSKTGMGGSRNVGQRMRTSAKAASGLYNTFSALRDDNSFSFGRELLSLKEQGANADQIIDAIVKHVCPDGGSIDEISCRDSGTAALSEFMDHNPEADFFNLSDDQIWTLTALFLGNEIFNRVQIDIGQVFEKTSVPYVDRVTRLNDMRDYICSEVTSQLNQLRESIYQRVDMDKLFQKIIKNTFDVFEVEV